MTIRIAMWSGPRNISTAMLRSWENRPDTYVCDEPLYAYYLNETGKEHPGKKEIIEKGETDWKEVTKELVEMNSENRATVSSRANPENVLNQAVGMEAYHPTGLQSNRSYKQWGKDYYKKNVTEALLEGCIKDKKK